jgi:hypothetical protein
MDHDLISQAGTLRCRMTPIVATCIISFMLVGQARSDDGAGCTPDAKGMVTVKGTIRFLFSRVVPMRSKTGRADYSIVDNIDYYELTGVQGPCGPGPLRIRVEFGHVKTVSCADGAAAEASGFYHRDLADNEPVISVVPISALHCK